MDAYRRMWKDEVAQLQDDFGPFRFDVGQKVKCNLGPETWGGGTIVKQYYRDPQWPPERWCFISPLSTRGSASPVYPLSHT